MDAAERDTRSALRQLVLAGRDLRAKWGLSSRSNKRPAPVAEVVPGPGASASPGA